MIFEVYKHLSKHRGKSVADRFASQALMRKVVPLDETIALAAANVSLEHRLSGTDAIVYATARVCQAQLVTSNTLASVALPAVHHSVSSLFGSRGGSCAVLQRS